MLREDGKVIWNLRKPWRDGTQSFVFDPLVFLERLVALIPHPREHQLTYHGCLAPASPVRDHVVPLPPSRRERPTSTAAADPNQPIETERRSWVGKRLWNAEEHGRPVRADDLPAHGVLAVVRRDPSRSVVNRVLRAHLETFLDRFNDEHGGRSLPAYVERELRAVIAYGDIAHGFCRVRCPCCALDLLVAFSCRG